jgi:hypothetical protein
MKAVEFLPTQLESVRNMAEFALAHSYFAVLAINVPTMLGSSRRTEMSLWIIGAIALAAFVLHFAR